MKKITLLCISILLYTTSCEKDIIDTPSPPLITYTSTNLCGIWYGYGYPCSGEIFNEIILIQHEGNLVTATKLTGDNCVNAGQMAWQGVFTQTPFNVNTTLGSPTSPNSVFSLDYQSITVVNLNYLITSSAGIEFVRATQEQINNEIQDIYFEAHNTYLDIDLEEICKPQS
jgi:hypothetical protein|tara:strand:+ start:310 stop:822 length:513 start_codon:yes stop_codon:yes gene_type:complete